ncbi:unnamed protein product [Anisakis simplex]|uniref:cardiolipin synthase (CMP-forming) n=1 Tax=Anisakis simplex TaxID=6269 RepID=A0A3P6SMA8_ANISI|nr:unnamed protein product [Anisakis simplex]
MVVEEYFTVGLYLLSIAGITDLLDGLIARHIKGQSSLLGSVLDPVADKLLVSTLFITLTYVNLIPLLLTIIVISRDICLITGGFVKRYRLLVPPITLKRYFDPSVSPVKVAPTMVSKVNTALQLSLVACSLASPVFGFVGYPYLTALWSVLFEYGMLFWLLLSKCCADWQRFAVKRPFTFYIHRNTLPIRFCHAYHLKIFDYTEKILHDFSLSFS